MNFLNLFFQMSNLILRSKVESKWNLKYQSSPQNLYSQLFWVVAHYFQ